MLTKSCIRKHQKTEHQTTISLTQPSFQTKTGFKTYAPGQCFVVMTHIHIVIYVELQTDPLGLSLEPGREEEPGSSTTILATNYVCAWPYPLNSL